MAKQQPQDQPFAPPGYRDMLGYAYGVAHTLASITEPFTSGQFGKKYFGLNALLGGGLLFCWVSASPGHEAALMPFCVAWVVAVALQMILARWNHYFGTRQLTQFMGVPFICHILPIGLHFARRVVNPLLVFGIASLVQDAALAALLQLSAAGQAMAFGFVYAIKTADDDVRSDALLKLRNR